MPIYVKLLTLKQLNSFYFQLNLLNLTLCPCMCSLDCRSVFCPAWLKDWKQTSCVFDFVISYTPWTIENLHRYRMYQPAVSRNTKTQRCKIHLRSHKWSLLYLTGSEETKNSLNRWMLSVECVSTAVPTEFIWNIYLNHYPETCSTWILSAVPAIRYSFPHSPTHTEHLHY